MAKQRIKVPDLGESVNEIVLVEWHVTVGQEVVPDQALATVETDKVDTEIPSPVGGVVAEILMTPGETMKVGDAICIRDS